LILSSSEITLTSAAIEAARRALEKRGTPLAFLRLGVRGSGCSGVAYVIEFADEKRDNDHVYEFDSLHVLIDPKSLIYLRGSTLDYEKKNLVQFGFKFINPNAKSTCGCGESFDV
jgi:iron-sulfur cluster assembly protein